MRGPSSWAIGDCTRIRLLTHVGKYQGAFSEIYVAALKALGGQIKESP